MTIKNLSSLGFGMAFLLALCGVFSAPLYAQEVMLKWGFQEGSQTVTEINTRLEMSVPGVGPQVMDQTLTIRQTVENVGPNGEATLVAKTERLVMEGVGPAGDQFYDSDTGDMPADPMILVAAAMVGKSYSMVVGPEGTVTSVHGIEELIESLRTSFPPEVAPMLDEMFSAEVLIENAQTGFQMLPVDPIRTGDTWNTSFTVPNPVLGEMTNNITFVLEQLEERDGKTVALLSSTGEMVFDDPGGRAGLPMEVEVDMDADYTGSATFELDRGLTLSSTATNKLVMTMSGPDGESMAMPMTTVVTTELIEYVPGG